MYKTVGTIREMNRFPVKSMGGEALEVCTVEKYGMKGDRVCSFRDESKQGWSKYITARQHPSMLSYQAYYRDNGYVQVKTPDGRMLEWDNELLKEITERVGKPIRMTQAMEPHPEAEHNDLLSVDAASLLLITDASLRRLEELWGKPVDQRRFRGNFVIALNEEALNNALGEESWIGRRLEVGGVRLQVDSYCQRCVMITMNPDTREKDPSLLRKVNEDFGLHFGVYASVIEAGEIRRGDQVTLLD